LTVSRKDLIFFSKFLVIFVRILSNFIDIYTPKGRIRSSQTVGSKFVPYGNRLAEDLPRRKFIAVFSDGQDFNLKSAKSRFF
jgi:hypothetical protein